MSWNLALHAPRWCILPRIKVEKTACTSFQASTHHVLRSPPNFAVEERPGERRKTPYSLDINLITTGLSTAANRHVVNRFSDRTSQIGLITSRCASPRHLFNSFPKKPPIREPQLRLLKLIHNSKRSLNKQSESDNDQPNLLINKTAENGRNVTSFRGMASVASNMGWLWTGWIGPAPVQMSGMLSGFCLYYVWAVAGFGRFFIDLSFLREQSPWSFSGLDSCVLAYCGSGAPLLFLPMWDSS